MNYVPMGVYITITYSDGGSIISLLYLQQVTNMGVQVTNPAFWQ